MQTIKPLFSRHYPECRGCRAGGSWLPCGALATRASLLRDHHYVVGPDHIEALTGALVDHVRVEALRPQQRRTSLIRLRLVLETVEFGLQGGGLGVVVCL